MNADELKAFVTDVPDFPEPGILFRDITTLLGSGDAFHALVCAIADRLRGYDIDLVIGPEARGFIIGSAVAYELHAGFVPARKPGKLPRETVSLEYGLEYGSNTLELHRDAVKPGMRAAVVDDLLATGGTAAAAVRLAESMGAEVTACAFAAELTELEGRKLLEGRSVISIITY